MKKLLILFLVLCLGQATSFAQSTTEGVRAPLNQLALRAGLEASQCYDLPVAKRASCVREAKSLLSDTDAFTDATPAEQRLAKDWLDFASKKPLEAVAFLVDQKTGLPLPDPVQRQRLMTTRAKTR